jgi:Sel1 repeat
VFLPLAAEAGSVEAQCSLGKAYEIGEGVEANPVKAIRWYQKGMLSRILQNINTLSVLLSPAAEAGYVKAQYNLGKIFQNGDIVEANPFKAIEWYRKGMLSRTLRKNIDALSALLSPAAEAGCVGSQFYLKEMTKIWERKERIPVKVVEWLQKGMFT